MGNFGHAPSFFYYLVNGPGLAGLVCGGWSYVLFTARHQTSQNPLRSLRVWR